MCVCVVEVSETTTTTGHANDDGVCKPAIGQAVPQLRQRVGGEAAADVVPEDVERLGQVRQHHARPQHGQRDADCNCVCFVLFFVGLMGWVGGGDC